MCTTLVKSFCALSLLVSLSLTGCMVSPATGYCTKTRTEKVRFEGYTNKPGQTVSLFAQRVSDQVWIPIGSVKTTTNGISHFGGDWYIWSGNFKVPASCWHDGGPIFKPSAFVKAVADGNDLCVFEEGFYDYLGDYDSIIDLYNDHERGTMAWICTEDN